MIFKKDYRKMEMVKYWQKQDSVEAKVILHPKGHFIMQMEGEKYPFPGFPRGVLLYGALSPLKHWIKNRIFNETWAKLEENQGSHEWIDHLKTETLPGIYEILEEGKYNMVPYQKMVPPVKEIWRAMEVIEEKTGSKKVKMLKELICFILQEDDAYRFRFQWMVKFIPRWWKPKLKHFEKGLSMLEQGEIVGDMKERQRLFKRIILFVLQDEAVRNCFELLLKEMDWNKLRLSKGDKYFFRAKYFKVDYPEYQY